MALTRKMLKAMGIEEEKIDQICEEHMETVNAIKAERDGFKADAEKVVKLEAELESANSKLADSEKNSYKVKYEAIKEEFETYKSDITAKEQQKNRADAYMKLLKETGVSEKRINSVLKVTDLSEIEIDENGNIKNKDDLTSAIKSEWADFIETSSESGANVPAPPTNTGGSAFDSMSLADKMAYANSNPDSADVQKWLKGE